MDKKVKLTYIFTLGYKINPFTLKVKTVDSHEFATLMRASLMSEHYNTDITDVIDFMKQFKPRIPRCLMK